MTTDGETAATRTDFTSAHSTASPQPGPTTGDPGADSRILVVGRPLDRQRFGRVIMGWSEEYAAAQVKPPAMTPAERVRRKPLSDLTEEEKAWMAMDRIIYPDLYLDDVRIVLLAATTVYELSAVVFGYTARGSWSVDAREVLDQYHHLNCLRMLG